jgi:hypothetical protein
VINRHKARAIKKIFGYSCQFLFQRDGAALLCLGDGVEQSVGMRPVNEPYKEIDDE